MADGRANILIVWNMLLFFDDGYEEWINGIWAGWNVYKYEILGYSNVF